MSKFKVMIVKKDGKPVGVRAAQVNGRTIVLSLHDKEEMTWYDAVKENIPSIADWAAIAENLSAVNAALEKAGGEPLKGWYWSSSEDSSYTAWRSGFSGDYGLNYGYYTNKNYSYEVRPVLAF